MNAASAYKLLFVIIPLTQRNEERRFLECKYAVCCRCTNRVTCCLTKCQPKGTSVLLFLCGGKSSHNHSRIFPPFLGSFTFGIRNCVFCNQGLCYVVLTCLLDSLTLHLEQVLNWRSRSNAFEEWFVPNFKLLKLHLDNEICVEIFCVKILVLRKFYGWVTNTLH